MARLLRAAVLPARLGAGLFYAVNPFVFDRLYAGQLGVLLGYALLPFAVDALLDAARKPAPCGARRRLVRGYGDDGRAFRLDSGAGHGRDPR